MRLLRSAMAALLLGFLASGAAAALPSGVTRGPSMGGIHEYRLANGLQVLLVPDPARDTITVNATYLVGSRHEGYGEAGMAHLLEHLLFKGTPRYPNPKTEFTARGARYNGTTSFDRTNYFATFPATEDNLRVMLDIEADRMVNAHVSKKDLESEMTVVRNEFESGENNPYNLLRERMSGAAYTWHNYGRSVIGTRSDIENVPIERLQAFYRQYYQPDNAALVVAGRFDEARALALIAQTFGKIPAAKRPLTRTYTVEPPQDGDRTVTVRRVGEVQIVAAMYHMPPGTHGDYPAVDLLVQILSAQPSGRLHKALVETGKAAASFGTERQQREAGSAFFGATVKRDESLDAARTALLDVVEGFARQPVSDEELARARTKIENDIKSLLDNTSSLAITLSEFVAMGDWRLLFWYRDQLAKTTRDDVQRVAVAYLRPANRTLGLFFPVQQAERVAIPAAPDVQALLKDYRGGMDVAAGEAFDPTPANIEARVIRRQLPGGMQLAMLPKKTRGEKVVATLALQWGDESSVANRASACGLLGPMLSRGTRQLTREQLRDELDRLRANVSVSAGGASLDTTRGNLPEAMRLAAQMLREPSFPAMEFEQVKRQATTSLDSQRTDPQSLASLAINRHLNPYPPEHWYYTPTLDEQAARLAAVTLDDVRRCHADFLGASHAQLAVVGDFDPEEVARLAQQLFGDWKSPSPYRRIPARSFDVKAMDRLIETPDKANAVYRAGQRIAVKDSDPDYVPLLLGNYLLGGTSDARLARRIRERDGISYSVGSWLSVGVYEPVSEFGVRAILAPQNRDRLETAVREEIQRVLADGFTVEEIERGKQGLLQAIRVARNSDSNLAEALRSHLEYGRTYAWNAANEKRLAALTPAEVRDAVRRHIRLDEISVVKAGDFGKAVAGSTAPEGTAVKN
jgi:zinc protease